MLELTALGWDPALADQLTESSRPARVSVVERGHYFLLGLEEPLWARCTGRLLNEAADSRDLPAVGDWVAVINGVIVSVLPRSSCFVRKAAGTSTTPQVICANVTTVFVVTAVGVDLNPRRIERYVAAVSSAGAAPVVVINKSDLAGKLDEVAAGLETVTGRFPVVCVSARAGTGMDALLSYLQPGQTVALVGSSGVGKSSLVNRLLGEDRMKIGAVSDTDGKGQHTTTRRELMVLPERGLIIDTPGMREFGLWEAEVGLDTAFPDVEALAAGCRFRDCKHSDEPGCAVIAAAASGTLASDRLASYQRLHREASTQERKAAESGRRKPSLRKPGGR